MGSPRLFFTSIFRCQGARSLSDYTKGDIKELFTELLCIDDLKAKAEKAKAVKNRLTIKRDALFSESRRLEEVVSSEDIKRVEQQSIPAEVEATTSEILSKEKEIEGIERQIQSIELKVSLQEESLKNKASVVFLKFYDSIFSSFP